MLTKILIAAPVLVSAFGGADQAHDACDTCLCANDPTLGPAGTDNGGQKCCPTEAGLFPTTWDTYCDNVMLGSCAAACSNEEGEITTKRQHVGFRSTNFASQGRLGFGCNSMGQCEDGAYCVAYKGVFGYQNKVCRTFMQGLRAMLAPNVDIQEQGSDIVFTTPTPWSATTIAQVEAAIRSRLGVSESITPLVQQSQQRRLLQQQGYQYRMPMPSSSSSSSSSSTKSSSRSMCTSASCCSGIPSGGKDSTSQFKQWGVELLAFDWDKTACTEHTFKGNYPDYCAIAKKVSRDYIATANGWCRSGNPTSIVTYNDATLYVGGQGVNGKNMIKTVLGMVLEPSCASKIQVYARNEQSQSAGKSWHLQSAQQKYGVSNQKTCLVDDTRNNIDVALRKNPRYQTVYVNPATGYKTSDNKNHNK